MDKEALVKFNGFLAPKAEGSYLILNEGGYQIEGQTDTWKVIDEKNVQEQRFVQLVCEQTKKQKPDIVLHDSGVLVAQTIYGFDSSVMKKIEKFLREQKPELLHHQKFLENGTAERAKESGTEQNYNMIDVRCISLVSVFSRLKEESNWTLADAEPYIESLIAFYQDHHQTTFRVMEASEVRRLQQIPCRQVLQEIFEGKFIELKNGMLRYKQ